MPNKDVSPDGAYSNEGPLPADPNLIIDAVEKGYDVLLEDLLEELKKGEIHVKWIKGGKK